jgi:hypothetical protein
MLFFALSSSQREIYDASVRSIVDSVLQGFNGTVFAYGQTGTGKSKKQAKKKLKGKRKEKRVHPSVAVRC